MSDLFYTSPEWRALRAAFLRQHPVCAVPGCGRLSKHVDHKIRRRKRPDLALAPANLQALCRGCHSRKTAGADGRFGNASKANYTLRAVGCNADGLPLDPTSHWFK